MGLMFVMAVPRMIVSSIVNCVRSLTLSMRMMCAATNDHVKNECDDCDEGNEGTHGY